jgi:hypothetical protein
MTGRRVNVDTAQRRLFGALAEGLTPPDDKPLADVLAVGVYALTEIQRRDVDLTMPTRDAIMMARNAFRRMLDTEQGTAR